MILIQDQNHKDQKNTLLDEIPSFWEQDFFVLEMALGCSLSTADFRDGKWIPGPVFR